MSEFLYTNNAVTTLAAGINNSVTTLTVATGTGVLFPNPSAGQQFNVTLIDGSGNYEIISVTARATDVFTIVRAQENTTALSFLLGDRVELRVTAAGMNNMVQETATQSVTNKTIDYTLNTLTGVQPTLVSGTNIKTVGGQSLLGSGDITIVAGALVHLSRVTASASATVDCEWVNSSDYDEIIIRTTNVVFDAAGILRCRMKLGGSYDTTSNYGYSLFGNTTVAAGVTTGANTLDYVTMTLNNVTFAAGDSLFLKMSIPGPSSALRKRLEWRSIHAASPLTDQQEIGHAAHSSTAALTGIRFYNNNGNISSGTFDIYGVKHA